MKLTSQGKQLVKEALTDKKLVLQDLVEPSQLSIDTIKRFSAQHKVSSKSFVTLCQLLEIDWRIASGEAKHQIISEQNTTSELTHSTNPFMQRGMLSNIEDVYGRSRELRQVFEFLHSGASVALVGCGGMGTSSLLYAVEQKAAEDLPKRKPVYINMSTILDLQSYYATLADAVGSDAVEAFQVQRELKKHRILLLLDDVEQLRENWFNNGVRQQLRGWANAGEASPLRLVVAAHRPLTELFEDSGLDSPFANICHELELQPWDAETIQGFIHRRLAGTGVNFTAEEIGKIFTQSQGIPSQVMQLCYQCYQCYEGDRE